MSDLTPIVESSVEIGFAVDEASVVLESNVHREPQEQAELVLFAQYAARVIVALRDGGLALPLSQSLALLEEASTEHLQNLARPDGPGMQGVGNGRLRVTAPERPVTTDRGFRATLQFLGAKKGPRFRYTSSSKGFPAHGREGDYYASASVLAFLSSLLSRRLDDRIYLHRLARTGGLMGHAAGKGSLTTATSFDIALAAADVAWRDEQIAPTVLREPSAEGEDEIECPSCGNRGSATSDEGAFEFRLWPSEAERIRRCGRCGGGLWLRKGRVRLIASEIWRTMEDLRDELATSRVRTYADTSLSAQVRPSDAAPEREPSGDHSLLDDLKAVFVEHRWPFTEVHGAPVLLTELSGPLERWKFFAQVVQTQRVVAFYSVCPLTVPDDRRVEIANYLTRANYGLALGNFELDFDDGEIRFKTVLQVEGELSAALVKKLVRANGMAMETYLPGIGAVITGMPALPAIERRTPT